MENNSTGNIPFDLLKNIFVPTAIISALGYFWGWGVIVAYWGYLGVSASFVQASIPEVVLVGWLELFLAAVALVIGIGSFRAADDVYTNLKRKSWFLMNNLFFFFLFLSVSLITGLTYGIYLIVSPFSSSLVGLIFLLAIPISFFWMATLLGYQIDRDPESNKHRYYPVFKVAFPSFYLYLIIMILGSIIWLNRLSIVRGIELAKRDASLDSSLLEATIYAEIPLPLSGTFDSITGLYEYDDLQFVDANEDLVVVLKRTAPSQTTSKDFLTYVLARDKITLIEFQP